MEEESVRTETPSQLDKSAEGGKGAQQPPVKRKTRFTTRMVSATLALIFTRIVFPLMLVISSVLRISLVSGIFLILAISYVAYSYPRPPTKSSYIRPALVLLLSIVSLILQGIHQSNSLGESMELYFGVVEKTGETKGLVSAYYAADVIALIGSVFTIVILALTQLAYYQARREKESIPLTNKDQGIVVEDDGEKVTVFESNPDDIKRKKDGDSDSDSLSGSDDDDSDDDDDDDDSEDDESEEEEEEETKVDEEVIDVDDDDDDYSPRKLYFIPTISYGRSLTAIFIAACAASFAPSVLTAPYAVFIFTTCLFVAWPRRKYTIVNIPAWTSMCGIAVFVYACLHALIMYAYQFYYKTMTQDSSVAPAIAGWTGLYDRDSVLNKENWMIGVSFFMNLLLMFFISPAVRSFKRLTEAKAARMRERFRCPDMLTPILCLSVSPKSVEAGVPVQKKKKKKSETKIDRRALILGAVYPHGWKLGIIIMFFYCLVSPGIPAFACLALLLITTFTAASFAAATSGIFFAFFLVLLCIQYFFNTGVPPALYLFDNYADLIEDLSIPSITMHYKGLFFILCFIGLYLVAEFVRIHNAQKTFIKIAHTLDLSKNVLTFGSKKSQALKRKMKIEERKKRRREAKRRKLEKRREKARKERERQLAEQAKRAEAEKAAFKKVESTEIDVDDDTDPYAEPRTPPSYAAVYLADNPGAATTTTTTTTTTTNAAALATADKDKDHDIDDDGGEAHRVTTMKPMHKESSRSRLKRSASSMLMLMGKKGQKSGDTLKSVLLTILVNVLRYSYFLSLLALYFTAVSGSNVLNILMFIVFIIFLVKPIWARKGWVILLAYADLVLVVRCVWCLHWIPENGTISTIVGVEKDRSMYLIEHLVWEVILVLCATIQLFFLRVADVTETSNGGPANSKDSKDKKKDKKGDAPLSSMTRNSTLDSIAEASKVELIDKIGQILSHCLQHGGMFLCCLCWMLCGILMPLSVVSLLYLLLSFVVILFIFYMKSFHVHLKRVWVIFLIWEGLVLCGEYVFQCSELHDFVLDAYNSRGIRKIISLEEIGLVTLATRGQRFAGMLPYVACFVISILQLHMFSISQKSELEEGTLSPVTTGIIDFICRFFFIYSPLIMYVFSAVLLVKEVSLVHFVLLFVMMVSRVHRKGLDFVGGILLWLTQIFVICNLAFNLRAFDDIANKYAPLFRWIGFTREYIPSEGTGAHTENMRMVYEYVVVFILLCIERRSLKWGEATAKKIGWCAKRPRYMSLFRFLDTLPSWTEEERAEHPGLIALDTICNLPLYLTKQAMMVLLLLCFYFRSATLLGWVYLFIVMLKNRGKERLRKMAPTITALLLVLISFQYVCTLGRPSLYGMDEWPWMSLAGSLQQWLLLYMPHPVLLICDTLLLYFVTAVRYLDPEDPDFFTLITPHDLETFPNPPRTVLQTIRYVFYRIITVIIICVMLIIGFCSDSAVSLVFLIAALILLTKQDYVLTRYHPWKTMLSICYVLIFLQLIIQLVFVIVNGYSDDSEGVTDKLKLATVVLGVDFTTQDEIYPTKSTLYLMTILLVLSFLRSLHRSNKDAFYMTRVYCAELNLQAEQRAMDYNQFKTDVVIKSLEAIYSEKAERRCRLESLRESRKRRRLLFPDLMAEIDDNASTVSGGSLLSANEALYRANVKEDTGDDKDKKKKKGKKGEGEEEKIPIKTRIMNVLKVIGRFFLRIIDVIIFWLHGKEGECEGSMYGHDILILKEEHELLVNNGKKNPATPAKPAEAEAATTTTKTEGEKAAEDDKDRNARNRMSALLTKEALQAAAERATIETFLNAIALVVSSKEVEEMQMPDITCTMVKCATDSECMDILGDFTVKEVVAMTQSNFEGHDDVREMLATLQTLEDPDAEEPAVGGDKCPYTLGTFVRASSLKISSDPSLDKIANKLTMNALFKYITYVDNTVEETPMVVEEEKKEEPAADDEADKDKKEEEEADKKKRRSRWTLFYTGLGVFIGTSSESICMLAFLINFLAQGTILSCVYVVFGFGYVAISRRPHPLKPFWTFICIYTAVIIGLKSLMQLPGMCVCHSSAIHIWYFSKNLVMNRSSIVCPEPECMQDSGTAAQQFSPPYLLGLVTQGSFSDTNLFWDIVVLLVVLFHMQQMIKQGLWNDATCDKIEKDKERFVTRLNELKIEDATASPSEVETTEAVQGLNEHYLSFSAGEVIHVISRSTREGATSIGELDGVTGLFDIKLTKPYIPPALLAAKKKKVEAAEQQQEGKKLGRNKSKSMKDSKKLKDDKDKKKKKVLTKAEERRTLKYFYDNLIHDNTRLGKDYYTPMFFCEFVCFIYLLFAASTFTGSAGALVEYIKQSYLPGAYVAVLLLQFIFIIIDRIVYLRRSVIGKLVLQYVTLVLYSVLCLWYFPSQMKLTAENDTWTSGFSSSSTLQVFFLFKCLYWHFSGVQIREGYPMLSCDRFLMRKYSMVDNWIHTGYRCIPFVYEMRTILDWTFIPTTLDFFNYLRVEDIYAELYNVGCLVAARAPRKPGEPQTMASKCSMGCLLFVVIVIVIWLPLILLSSAVPGLTGISISPINDAELTVAVQGLPPFYEQYVSAEDLISIPITSDNFSYLRRGHTFIPTDKGDIQWTRFTEFSSTVWDMTPPGKELLRTMISNETNPLNLVTRLTVSRSSASNSVVTYIHTTTLNKTERRAFLNALTTGNGSSVTISSILPRYIKTPGSTGDAVSPCNQTETASQCTPVNFTLTYYGCFDGSCPQSDWGNEFWGISQVPEDGDSLFTGTRPEIVLIHTPVSSSTNLLGTIAAYGLIGIYATIILAVANVIRGMTSGLAHRIMFVLLPNPYDLLQLCHDIILARMDGDLLLEEELSNELIQIYRSPESIIDHTRIPLPPPEEQDDLEDDMPDDDIDDDDDDMDSD